MKELIAFAAVALRDPARVGAVLPASHWLAGAIATEALRAGHRRIVEVGAGTGSVTRALLESGAAPERLVAIERDSSFVDWLRRSAPGISVVLGCASQCRQVVERGVPTAIVSSLPFKSLPPDEARACARALTSALGECADSILVQYSYGVGRTPPFATPAGMKWSKAATVLRNVPPATVWVLRHAAEAA